MLTIVGLGPARLSGASPAARKAMRAADRLWVRTVRHPAVDDILRSGKVVYGLDHHYEQQQSFNQVYDAIVDEVVSAGLEGDLVYAVPGHPNVAEETVRRLKKRCGEVGLEYRTIGSPSFIETTLEMSGASISESFLLRDALSISENPPRGRDDLLIYQVYDRSIASDVKLSLMPYYPDNWDVTLVMEYGGRRGTRATTLQLHAIDRQEINHLTCLYVPKLPTELRRPDFDDLVAVTARLRGPGGCPWDIEQNHQTLRRYMIEECYEAVEAIDDNDLDSLRDELGDVLLQVVFHAQMGSESGAFDVDDVTANIVHKLIRRHPHVFGDLTVADSGEVLRNWETIKKSEKEPGWRESVLDGVPKGLPALMLALEISKKVVKVGFEWEKFEDIQYKLNEELSELQSAITTGDQRAIRGELGDVLFTLVNISRWLKLDPEESLREMVGRFSSRFRSVEAQARELNRPLTDMTLNELDVLWAEAKRRELTS